MSAGAKNSVRKLAEAMEQLKRLQEKTMPMSATPEQAYEVYKAFVLSFDRSQLLAELQIEGPTKAEVEAERVAEYQAKCPDTNIVALLKEAREFVAAYEPGVR